MQFLTTLASRTWEDSFPASVQAEAVQALEEGKVLVFPNLAFPLHPDEHEFLSPKIVEGSKNVSYDPATGKVGGTGVTGDSLWRLRGLLARYARTTSQLLHQLLPSYRAGIRQGRTSLRPVEIAGRVSSWRKDDTRLHVDSFPSMPTRGRRLLRVFCNINDKNQPRVWRIGESFESVARRFWPSLPTPSRIKNWLLCLFRVTKGMRTPYDHYMLQLHDRMKSDPEYQTRAEQVVQEFPPGSTCIVYTDQVPHAAVAGIHQLEQTFYVPVNCLHKERTAPLRVLEHLAERKLA
jgi:hypothetical protein